MAWVLGCGLSGEHRRRMNIWLCTGLKRTDLNATENMFCLYTPDHQGRRSEEGPSKRVVWRQAVESTTYTCHSGPLSSLTFSSASPRSSMP